MRAGRGQQRRMGASVSGDGAFMSADSHLAKFGLDNFPAMHHQRLWHLGTLNPDDMKWGSYEGAGLSVSDAPAAWLRIAKLGGNPLWELNKQSATFLDYYALTEEDQCKLKKMVVRAGWATRGQAWRVCYFNDEFEQEEWMLFKDRSEAEEEAECRGEGKVDRVQTLLATNKLAQRNQNCKDGDAVDLDNALLALIDDECLELDGIWWEETLDPVRLSAPRGVIFSDRLAGWSQRELTSCVDSGVTVGRAAF